MNHLNSGAQFISKTVGAHLVRGIRDINPEIKFGTSLSHVWLGYNCGITNLRIDN